MFRKNTTPNGDKKDTTISYSTVKVLLIGTPEDKQTFREKLKQTASKYCDSNNKYKGTLGADFVLVSTKSGQFQICDLSHQPRFNSVNHIHSRNAQAVIYVNASAVQKQTVESQLDRSAVKINFDPSQSDEVGCLDQIQQQIQAQQEAPKNPSRIPYEPGELVTSAVDFHNHL